MFLTPGCSAQPLLSQQSGLGSCCPVEPFSGKVAADGAGATQLFLAGEAAAPSPACLTQLLRLGLQLRT